MKKKTKPFMESLDFQTKQLMNGTKELMIMTLKQIHGKLTKKIVFKLSPQLYGNSQLLIML